MKKLVSLFLALLLAVGAVSALAEVDLSQYVADPAEKFTIAWLAGHDTDPIEKDNPVLQWLEEKFNVELDVWFLERENYDELLTTRIIGGEIPDAFMLQNATQFSKYVKQGVVMELRHEQDGRVRCSAVRLPEGSFARAMQLLRYLCENSVGLEQWLEVLADVGQSYELLENAGTAGMIPDFAGENLDFCAICRF